VDWPCLAGCSLARSRVRERPCSKEGVFRAVDQHAERYCDVINTVLELPYPTACSVCVVHWVHWCIPTLHRTFASHLHERPATPRHTTLLRFHTCALPTSSVRGLKSQAWAGFGSGWFCGDGTRALPTRARFTNTRPLSHPLQSPLLASPHLTIHPLPLSNSSPTTINATHPYARRLFFPRHVCGASRSSGWGGAHIACSTVCTYGTAGMEDFGYLYPR